MSQTKPVERLTQEDRVKRRKQIADFVAKGKTPAQAAKHFRCSLRHVQDSCKENGVVQKRIWTTVPPSAA